MKFTKLITQIEKVDSELKNRAIQSVNQMLTIRNWLIGYYIYEYEQGGLDRAKYGKALIRELSKKLTDNGMKGMSFTNLNQFRQFYLAYPQIVQTVSEQFALSLKAQKASQEYLSYSPNVQIMLQHFSFSHFLELLKVEKPLARAFYEQQAIKGCWSVRELSRQISSLLFERTALSKDKKSLLSKVKGEIASIEDSIRDPYLLEFTGLEELKEFSENDLEAAILNHIQNFLLELGKGVCFEARQKRITIGNEHDRIDLVFYHRLLKCHVLIDFKTRPFSHADVGQMNFYLNYYRENEMSKGDKPPVGIILCTSKDAIKVQYATLGLSHKMFVSRYMLELPTVKQLESFIKDDIKQLKVTKAEK